VLKIALVEPLPANLSAASVVDVTEPAGDTRPH